MLPSSSSSSSSSSSDLSGDVSRFVLSCLPSDSKVLAVASAKVYQMPFSSRPQTWTYTGLSGTLVFGRNRSLDDSDSGIKADHKTLDGFDHTFWFRLLDPSKGLVWQHQIPDGFEYTQDKPFFHMFTGKSRMFGFRFDADTEATSFLQIVRSNISIRATSPRKITKASGGRQPLLKRLTLSMISRPTPGSFKHVAHVGFDTDGRIEASQHTDSEWIMAMRELQGDGAPVPATVIHAEPEEMVHALSPEAAPVDVASVAGNLSSAGSVRSATPPSSTAPSGASVSSRKAPWRKFTLQ